MSGVNSVRHWKPCYPDSSRYHDLRTSGRRLINLLNRCSDSRHLDDITMVNDGNLAADDRVGNQIVDFGFHLGRCQALRIIHELGKLSQFAVGQAAEPGCETSGAPHTIDIVAQHSTQK